MAYNSTTGEWDQEDASVSSRLTGLMSQQSPLIKQARAQGVQAANRRGLLNSSIAAGASQNAAYAAALPIASQEASQVHQANLSKQEFGQQQKLQSSDQSQQRYLQEQDMGFRERISGLDREAQERIAKMNLGASERAAAANLAASFEGSYASVISNIMNNTEMPADVRRQYVEQAGKVRDSNLALVEQMYGIDLNWGAPSQSTSGGGASSGGTPLPADIPAGTPNKGDLMKQGGWPPGYWPGHL